MIVLCHKNKIKVLWYIRASTLVGKAYSTEKKKQQINNQNSKANESKLVLDYFSCS